MKTVQSITAILAIVSSAVAQHRGGGGRAPPGQAPASVAPQSAASAASAPAGASTAVAPNAATTTTAAAVANSGNTGNAVAASSAAAPASSSGASSGGSGGNCITFTSDNPSWAYANSAPWTGSGTFGDLPGGKLCLPSNAAGGAMYIGSSAPGPGDTKLECYFPTDATQQSNCDMSLVDGYSLSVTCTMAGASQPQIGGSVDLWTSGTCPGGNQGGTCKNADGYSAAQSDVNAFFQPAIKSPNNYCIWVNCNQDSFFATGTEIKCHVSAGTPAARKREVGEAQLQGRSHPRSLVQLVGA